MSGFVNDMVVDEALSWLGTPYVHQASCKGVGADCLGLVRGIWRAIYAQEPEIIPPYSPSWAERQGQEVLWQALSRHLVPVDRGIGGGQILLFRMRREGLAKHLGVATGPHRFIHAFNGRGVVKSALTEPWKRRLVARFEFPKI